MTKIDLPRIAGLTAFILLIVATGFIAVDFIINIWIDNPVFTEILLTGIVILVVGLIFLAIYIFLKFID
ncbi:MAG: hypothetical protein BAJALOKI2v1_120077 [Promethearchaeota archaeon]|nr:MAG: hypothetical protein BAJALOKI2v1_120077 [Candidatus Lokiarchaeota archaeon]